MAEIEDTQPETREQRFVEQHRGLPDQPGVYLFRNAKGTVIYVGKAKSIRKRVASHFSNPSTQMGRDLLPMIERIESLVVTTEAEALLTEQNFIKQYKPRFNIRLRDDKSYPYIGISLDEAYPRVYFTRERHRRERAYFGPYSNAKRVRETLDLLGKIFLFRTCEGPEPGRRSGSPCLDYYIKRCTAPCVGHVSQQEYRDAIDGIVDFLSGRYRAIERAIEAGMRQAAAEQRFEDAALARNRLRAIRSLLERQRVASESIGTLDAIAIAVEGTEANAQVFQVRDGVLSDRQSFYLENEAGDDLPAVAEAFLLQYYGDAIAIPQLLVVQREVGALPAVAEALTVRRGGAAVELRAAERGDKRRILELAERNARLALDQEKLRSERRRQQRVEALERLQEALGLDALPLRVECFDISNLGGTHTVASMIVFEGGAPKKADYRRFTLRAGVEGVPDDFASMEEVLSRRLAQYERQHDRSPHDEDYDASFAALPNVVVIDGGKGQLSAGMRALEGFRRRGVAIVSLAKRIEEVFVPGRSVPIVLAHDTPELQLLQRVRDEAHRFAIGHHRIRRDRAMTTSVLDRLSGIGPARKRALLQHFGSPEAFLAASREQLEAVPGLPGKVARDLYAQLNKTGH
ncbi:MAG TPA: excinuclease ABC subunit UvrC [Conexibacter sp.]|jgi:excinuclease ABC subunit C|nr:excinuclease ABC subunit UvrC [Conexibacter sp.]